MDYKGLGGFGVSGFRSGLVGSAQALLPRSSSPEPEYHNHKRLKPRSLKPYKHPKHRTRIMWASSPGPRQRIPKPPPPPPFPKQPTPNPKALNPKPRTFLGVLLSRPDPNSGWGLGGFGGLGGLGGVGGGLGSFGGLFLLWVF